MEVNSTSAIDTELYHSSGRKSTSISVFAAAISRTHKRRHSDGTDKSLPAWKIRCGGQDLLGRIHAHWQNRPYPLDTGAKPRKRILPPRQQMKHA